MAKYLFSLLVVLSLGCGIEVDAKGALAEKWFQEFPLQSTCNKIDALCKTATSPPFESRSDYDGACVAYLDALKVDLTKLECFLYAEDCFAAQVCDLARQDAVVYSFTHTEPVGSDGSSVN